MTRAQNINTQTTEVNQGFIKQQIQVILTKTESISIVVELLKENNTAVHKAMQTALAGKFPQFPEHTSITLGETNETGTVVSLKIPSARRVVTPEFEADEPDLDKVDEEESITDNV